MSQQKTELNKILGAVLTVVLIASAVSFVAINYWQIPTRCMVVSSPFPTSTPVQVVATPPHTVTTAFPQPVRKPSAQPPQATTSTTTVATVVSHLNSFDTEVLLEMNGAREEAGLSPLIESAALDRVANDKVQDMIKTGSFSHLDSDGQLSWHWFISEGYIYRRAGENLAKGFTDPDAAFFAYMESPTHRKNILNPGYADVGLASSGSYEAVEFGAALTK